MKALAVVVLIAALGFGGYKLYQKRTATKVHGAFISLLCDTDFITQADPILRVVGGVNKNGSLQDMLASVGQIPAMGVTLADWVKKNVPAEKVSDLVSAGRLTKDQVGTTLERAIKDATIRCPDKMDGVNPLGLGMAAGTVVGVFKARGD
jgi:hypothetical protein